MTHRGPFQPLPFCDPVKCHDSKAPLKELILQDTDAPLRLADDDHPGGIPSPTLFISCSLPTGIVAHPPFDLGPSQKPSRA